MTGGLYRPVGPGSGIIPAVRQILTGNITYYVRTDGSDNNNGLTNTSAGAFATFAKAIATLNSLDGQGISVVTIQGNNATHTDQVNFNTQPIGIKEIFVDCAGGTINTSQSCIVFNAVQNCNITFQNMILTSSAASCLELSSPANVVLIGSGIVFGAATSGNHIYVHAPGSSLFINAPYTITGGAQAHVLFFNGPGATLNLGSNVTTLTGTPNFSNAFMDVNYQATVLAGNGVSYSGSATGQRYFVSANGVVDTNGAGANFFPGNSPGSTATGGQYI